MQHDVLGVNVLSRKPNNPSSILGTHIKVNEESRPLKAVLSPPQGLLHGTPIINTMKRYLKTYHLLVFSMYIYFGYKELSGWGDCTFI